MNIKGYIKSGKPMDKRVKVYKVRIGVASEEGGVAMIVYASGERGFPKTIMLTKPEAAKLLKELSDKMP